MEKLKTKSYFDINHPYVMALESYLSVQSVRLPVKGQQIRLTWLLFQYVHTGLNYTDFTITVNS